MESTSLYVFLDYFFVVFHTALIFFNLFGWLLKRLRKWHLGVISLTLASWFILGIWYGWGYCPLTDWHWDILRELGETGLPRSYITYLFDRLLSISITDTAADVLVVGLAIPAFLISIWLNIRDSRNYKS